MSFPGPNTYKINEQFLFQTLYQSTLYEPSLASAREGRVLPLSQASMQWALIHDGA